LLHRNAQGYRIGEGHHRARHADQAVERARVLREQGLTYAAIGRALDVHWRTVADWVNYRTR
jgi:hypothetical protein